jgi:hypothetical protein
LFVVFFSKKSVDWRERQESEMNASDPIERFSRVLGHAVIAAWSDLPKPVQHELFERAVALGHEAERDESLREELAQFLHEHHKRTAGS